MPRKIQRKTKAKARNVTQTVIVNVSKRGGGGSKAPTQPRPTAIQQATQLVQAMRPQQGESLVQAQQAFQRLVEPINARLEALLQRQQLPQPINIAPPNVNVNIPINELMRQINEIHARLPPQPRERVLDLPDAQLVQPEQPIVPAGPPRLDDPHEDVPLSDLEEEEPFAEEKQAAQPSSSAEEENPLEPSGFIIAHYKELYTNKASMGDVTVKEALQIMKDLNIPAGKKNRNLSAYKDKILAKLYPGQ